MLNKFKIFQEWINRIIFSASLGLEQGENTQLLSVTMTDVAGTVLYHIMTIPGVKRIIFI